jgi:hypothetical protein
VPNLRDLTKRLVQKAFTRQLGGFEDAATFQVVTNEYTPASSAVSTSTADTACTGKFVRSTLKKITDQGTVVSVPLVQFLLPSREIEGTTPKLGDQVVDTDGAVWAVDLVEIDPADALWVLTLRRLE